MIKRNLLLSLNSHLKKREISLIIGPRQAGKTTLMMLFKAQLEKDGHKTLYLSLDSEADREYFISQEKLIKKIELELGKQAGIVFIDEIQRKEDAGVYLKGIYDLNLPYKFVVSGSGSLELKEKIHESLAGRKRFFELNTLSFEEFVNFKTVYRYENNLGDFFSLEKEKRDSLLTEYLNYGGYPRVVLEETAVEKRKNVDEIVRSYLEKDIAYLLKVDKVDAFSSLMKILSAQVSQMVNHARLSSLANVSLPTLKNYLWYAQNTFVITLLKPYFKNIRKEITKSPVIYFNDLGFRNYLCGLFGSLTQPRDMGLVFQNFIFNLLKEKLSFSGADLHFWRTKDKAEVDFIIESGQNIFPLEVKYKSISLPAVESSLRNFVADYKPVMAFVVNLDFEGEVTVGETRVLFLPFFKLFDDGQCLSYFLLDKDLQEEIKKSEESVKKGKAKKYTSADSLIKDLGLEEDA